MKTQSILLRHDNDIVMEVFKTSITIQTFTMWMCDFAPYQLDDTDFIWECDDINADPSGLYSDFITTTECSLPMKEFMHLLMSARILQVSL